MMEEKSFPKESAKGESHSAEIGGALYDVYKLIELSRRLDARPRETEALVEALAEQDLWRTTDGDKLNPLELIKLAKAHNNNWSQMRRARPLWEEHINAIEKANYKVGSILTFSGNKVVDGAHRIVRALLDGVIELEVKDFTSMPKEAIYEGE